MDPDNVDAAGQHATLLRLIDSDADDPQINPAAGAMTLGRVNFVEILQHRMTIEPILDLLDLRRSFGARTPRISGAAFGGTLVVVG